jgi:peptide/nickel transport system ATP-binding protein
MKEILVVKNLKKHFQTPLGTVKAVDGISFSVMEGETFGVVGESGSGKSTVAYTIMGIYPPTDGEILFEGTKLSKSIKKRPKFLKKKLQIVFQDPGSSLNPKRTVSQILELPLKVHSNVSSQDRKKKVAELLQMVELPTNYADRYPRELGGGEKQAVAIARALATNPSLIVLDEPTSALDVSAQAKIIRMLIQFQQELNIPYVFITHNLILMRNVATRVAIMYLGKICEVASASEFFRNPLHPYTKMLLSSIPVMTKEEEEIKPKKIISTGEIPSPVNVPSGCSFHPRCPNRMEICPKVDPLEITVEEGHTVRCHLYDR